jgi:hypothetical protein
MSDQPNAVMQASRKSLAGFGFQSRDLTGKFISMKALVLLLFTRIMLVSLAGSFQNLDFDEASTNNANLFASPAGYSWGNGSASDLLPGWTLTHGGDLVTNLTFNIVPPDGDAATLYNIAKFGCPPPAGFALLLGFTHSQSYELTQSGELPTNAMFLSYSVVGNYLEVRIQDQLLQPITPGGYFSTGPGPRIMIFDISGFKGQSVKLSLRQSGQIDPGRGGTAGSANLDSVQIVSELPKLQISTTGTQLVVRWPASVTDFILQSKDSFSPQTPWQVVTQAPIVVGDCVVTQAPVVVGDQKTLTIDNQGQAKLFRLSLGGY